VTTFDITLVEARRLALRAQGLTSSSTRTDDAGPRAQRNAVRRVLDQLGAVQLDTISVLARSHELVAYARLGPIARHSVEGGYWSDPATAFEYWSHAACVLPISMFPWFAFRRREFRIRGKRWHDVPTSALKGILARLAAEGPLTTSELGGAKVGTDWWNWSDTKIAVEWLWDIGEVVVTRRTGWRRVYDLPERAIPAALLTPDPTDAECLAHLVGASGRTLGVATIADIADVHRLSTAQVRSVIGESGLVKVAVAGWPDNCYADPAALEQIGKPVRTPTTLLSPFDSLIWHRARTARLFGIEHRLEAYTPAAKRVHGYFAMPVLHRGQLIARVDPGREQATLVAKRVTFEPASDKAVVDSIDGVAAALRNAATWVGAMNIRVDQVTPPALAGRLRSAVRQPTATSASSTSRMSP
jgi:uncharacterized protein YcaQ